MSATDGLATLDRLLAWVSSQMRGFAIRTAMDAVFQCLSVFANTQYYTYITVGWILRMLWAVLSFCVKIVDQARAFLRSLERIFSPAPPPRCPICGTLLEYCNASFQYDGLADNMIRLIRLLPSAPGLQLETAAFSLSTAPSYSALSYRWTEEEPIYEIIMDCQTLHVRSNLYEYLRTAKEEAITAWMFIDALCINQHDLKERSRQVSLMRDIYSSAAEVVIFLRKPQILRGGDLTPEEKRIRWQALLRDHLGEENGGPSDKSDKDDESTTKHDMRLVLWFFYCSEDYWTRLWPVQEIMLASNLRLVSEGVELDWKRFRELMEERVPQIPSAALQSGYPVHKHFQNKPHQQNEVQNMVMMLELIGRKARMMEGKGDFPMSLHEAIVTFGGQKCTDPRDKIFGLLGIAQSCIQVDYQMPLAELYLGVLVEGLVAIMEDHESQDPVQEAFSVYVKLRTFIYSLQYALGIDGHAPATLFISTDLLSRLIPPQWIYYDLSWFGIGDNLRLGETVKPFVQGKEPWNAWVRVFWIWFFQYSLYTDACRPLFIDQNPWLSKLLSDRDTLKGPAKILFDVIHQAYILLARMRMSIHHSEGSELTFLTGSKDRRDFEGWTSLVTKVVKDMEKRGALPKKYTDYATMEIFNLDSEPKPISSACEPHRLD